MEEFNRIGNGTTEGIAAPQPAPTRAECWGLAASAVIAYVYILAVTAGRTRAWWFVGFAALLCAGAELALRDVPRRRESWVWLGCLWATLLCGAFGRGHAWSDWGELIAHGFGAYWLIVRAGALFEDRGSSRYFPAEVLRGAVTVPLGNLFLRLRVLGSLGRRRGDRRPAPAAVGAVAAAIASLFLLGIAVSLLSNADPRFQRLTDGVLEALDGLDEKLVFDLRLSVPVGAYLYGMVFGLHRESGAGTQALRRQIDKGVQRAQRVPAGVWAVLVGLFVALYAVFFAVQGSYLFDGLRGVLPEQFTASEYARRGFFELCGAMAVNFSLLCAASMSAEGGLRAHPWTRWASGILVAESGMLAVTAAAKLALYIRRFGFTPLRLQSAWLVLVLFAGCVAALRALRTGRDTAGAWLVFAGVTLALTQFW